jgi:hypothetical protein
VSALFFTASVKKCIWSECTLELKPIRHRTVLSTRIQSYREKASAKKEQIQQLPRK